MGESLIIEAGEQGPWRPTEAMAEVVKVITAAGEPLSGKRIEDAVGFKATTIRDAIEELIIEGVVERKPGPRGAQLHSIRGDAPTLDLPG